MMKLEEKLTAIKKFQISSFKPCKTLGFYADTANVIFSIIIEMRDIVNAAEQQDTILLHKRMGICASSIANYATVNSLKLIDALRNYDYGELEQATEGYDLEDYLKKIKDDLSFFRDMKESEKIQFIQKCWISVFPDEYHDDFIKVERILNNTIEDLKIKSPSFFIQAEPKATKYGLE